MSLDVKPLAAAIAGLLIAASFTGCRTNGSARQVGGSPFGVSHLIGLSSLANTLPDIPVALDSSIRPTGMDSAIRPTGVRVVDPTGEAGGVELVIRDDQDNIIVKKSLDGTKSHIYRFDDLVGKKVRRFTLFLRGRGLQPCEVPIDRDKLNTNLKIEDEAVIIEIPRQDRHELR